MNSTEAKEMAEFGMWTKISPSIKELITDACNGGEFEINISSTELSDGDFKRLVKLGYRITSDKSDKFDPRYFIGWE